MGRFTCIKKGIKAVCVASASLALRIGPGRKIVVSMDGGICSQMHFYLIGEMMRRQGYDVWYDLDWFDVCGKDMHGRFVRNFDLLRLFPNLPLKRMSGAELKFYRRVLMHFEEYADTRDPLGWLSFKAPMYMGGYYHDPEEMFRNLFREVFQPDYEFVLDAENMEIYRRIISDAEAVGIHVRRGDLAGYNEFYGHPVPTSYFIDSLKHLTSTRETGKVFIFSDEPDWVSANLLPGTEELGLQAEVVGVNGSDKGYMDLLLLSACRHIITSKGSMGKYAAMLRQDPSGSVYLYGDRDAPEWQSRFPASVTLD